MARSFRVLALAVAATAVGVVSSMAAVATPSGARAPGATPVAAASATQTLMPFSLTPATATVAPAVALRIAPPPPPPPGPVYAAGTPCLTTARACIRLSSKQAWLIVGNGIGYGPVPITSGRPGWGTPAGTFNVTFKSRLHLSTLFNDAPMPNSVFFNGGIAFHAGSLSVPSHGCIHLSNAASLVFFDTLNTGDIVQVVR